MNLWLTEDREALVAALRERGVDYLSPSDARPGGPIDDASLMASLAGHPDARLRQALIALFLLRADLAPLVPRLRDRLEERPARRLVAAYMAAVYLQRMWSIRLRHYLPSSRDLPDYFSGDLSLPGAEEGCGKIGLHALAERQARFSSFRANVLSEYEGAVDLLFQSLKWRHRSDEPSGPR